MKITITGSLGNISRPLAIQLVQAGHRVTVISSQENKRSAIEALGAAAAIGSVQDEAFLTSAFRGADAVYTMIPPNLQATEFRKYASGIAEQYAAAIRKSGVRRVVNLSSVGAHLDSGTGPIIGNHDAEAILNRLDQTSVTHVRACFFYTNFYGNINMIRNMGIIGSNYPGSSRLVMVHPEDIAAAVAEELQKTANQNLVRYISSDERKLQEVATVLGKAVGIDALAWVEFTDEQSKAGILKAGISEEMASRFVEMGRAVRSGILWSDYDANKITPSGKHKLESFAGEFAGKFGFVMS